MELWKQEAAKQDQFNKLLEPLQRETLRRRIVYGESTGNWDTTGLNLGYVAQSQRFR